MTDQPVPSEHCPAAPDDDPGHCSHWYDCEPCHRCGDDTRDPGCDCVRCWAARQNFRPGRFVDQTLLADPTRPDVMGNCWQTCIAGLLNLPLDQVPHFVQDHETMAAVEAATRRWAAGHGYAMVRLGVLEVDAHADEVLTLLCGESPRGVNHAVIGRGTDVLHDPHPSKAGLARITDVFAFLPGDPGASTRAGRVRELASWLALCADDTLAYIEAGHRLTHADPVGLLCSTDCSEAWHVERDTLRRAITDLREAIEAEGEA